MATNNEIPVVPTGAAKGQVPRFDGTRWQLAGMSIFWSSMSDSGVGALGHTYQIDNAVPFTPGACIFFGTSGSGATQFVGMSIGTASPALQQMLVFGLNPNAGGGRANMCAITASRTWQCTTMTSGAQGVKLTRDSDATNDTFDTLWCFAIE